MRKLLLFLPALFLLASCSSYQYNTTKIESKDFRQYKTYGWLAPDDSQSKDYFSNDIARANILDAANDALENMGMTYSKENPDVLFRYITIVNNKKRDYYNPYPYYRYYTPWYMPWYRYPAYSEAYRLAHVIIEARETGTNEVIWQARGSVPVDVPEKAINKLPKLVDGIMLKYPISKP